MHLDDINLFTRLRNFIDSDQALDTTQFETIHNRLKLLAHQPQEIPNSQHLLLIDFYSHLIPHRTFSSCADEVILMMIAYLKNEHWDSIVLQTVEFFASMLEVWYAPIQPFVAQIVPLLAKHVIYPEDQRETILRLHSAKARQDKSEEEKEDPCEGWTVRKCAASVFDALSSGPLKSDLYPLIMPLIKEMISSDAWEIQEAGLLIMGAVADLLKEYMNQQELTSIIKEILLKANSFNVVVISILCWHLARFPVIIGRFDLCAPVCVFYVSCMKREFCKLQSAACSGFATLVEANIGDPFVIAAPHLIPELGNLKQIYSEDSFVNLLDLLGAICTVNLSSDYLPQILIFLKDIVLNPESPIIQQIALDALAQGIVSHSDYMKQFAEELYCLCKHELDSLDPEDELIESYLGLLSVLYEKKCIRNPAIVSTAIAFTGSESQQIAMTACALMGDICSAEIPFSENQISDLMQKLTVNLTRPNRSLGHNASWAIGCLSTQLQYHTLPDLTVSTLEQEVKRSGSFQNQAAVTIFRLGSILPKKTCRLLSDAQFLISVRQTLILQGAEDMVYFVTGLIAMAKENLEGSVQNLQVLVEFFEAITIPLDLEPSFRQVMNHLRANFSPVQWYALVGRFPNVSTQQFVQKYCELNEELDYATTNATILDDD